MARARAANVVPVGGAHLAGATVRLSRVTFDLTPTDKGSLSMLAARAQEAWWLLSIQASDGQYRTAGNRKSTGSKRTASVRFLRTELDVTQRMRLLFTDTLTAALLLEEMTHAKAGVSLLPTVIADWRLLNCRCKPMSLQDP